MQFSRNDLSDTIVALATPPGVGAIAVIRLSGPEAIRICDAVFHGKDLSAATSHTIHFGTIRDGEERIIDEVLVSLFVSPRSYTGEHVVEVSCHGSQYIQQQLIQLFMRKGARLAQPGEFTLRAFLNGRMDLSQAEAVADLIASASESAHQVAMMQMRGGFSDEIRHLRQELINFASLIELELDFAEEDVEFANRGELTALIERIQQLLRRLIDSFQLGNAIKTGVSTVIAGRPNAGKSTLLNALLNEERAIVSEIAGTTRDTIEEVLNINGVPFRLIDTAGIREATDAIEIVGVARTMEKIQQSALLLYVFDIDELTPADVVADVDKLGHREIPLLLVANKTDKTRKDLKYYQGLTAHPVLFMSAKSPSDVDMLRQELFRQVLAGHINPGSTVVSNARHYEALTKASESLDDALRGIHTRITSDFIAMDIRRALSYLGEITGEISSDDLLGNIFSKFCIGK